MANIGKVQLIYIAVAPADLAEEGRRLFASHAKWMRTTHYREGPKELISYNVSTAPEPLDGWDESRGSTGRTVFVLSEVYESKAGVEDHQRQAESWSDYSAYVAWLQKCDVRGVSSAKVEQSLW